MQPFHAWLAARSFASTATLLSTEHSVNGTLQSAAVSQRIIWVKKEGDPDFAKLVSVAADVGDLKKEIVVKLGLTERLSTLTLHVAKDEHGSGLGDALDGRMSMVDAKLVQGTSIVVKVAGVAPAQVAAEKGMSRCSQPLLLQQR